MEDSMLTSRTSVNGDSKIRPPDPVEKFQNSIPFIRYLPPGALPLEVRNAAKRVATAEPKLCP